MVSFSLITAPKGYYTRSFFPFNLVYSFGQCFRTFSTSPHLFGKRNFRKFLIYNKRGTRQFKEAQASASHPDCPVHTLGMRPIGYTHPESKKFVTVPEMIPEIVVPDLEDFKLKPYVSYSSPDVVQSEFTARDLFDAVYREKICEDFKSGKLDSDGNSLEPSKEEQLTPDEAKLQARKTGSDIFG